MPADDDETSAREERGGEGAASPRTMNERQQRAARAAEERKARAAEKLRENLIRRKAQVRARRKGEAETGVGLPAGRPADDREPDA